MQKIFTRPQKFVLLIVFWLLMLLRPSEGPFTGGHILGEDATFFLAYAWHANFWQALWHPFAGYLNIMGNITGILTANLVKNQLIPLRSAPIFIQLFSSIFQIFPAILILWGTADWLNTRRSIVLALAVIVFCPKSDEVWLNGMHIQFWLALCCGLILVLNTKTNWPMYIFKGAILVIAPLSGPACMFLGPLFLIRSWCDRSLARFFQTVLLGIAGSAQLLLFYTSFPIRAHGLSFEAIINATIFRGIVIPVLGPISKKIGRINIYLSETHNTLFHGIWHLETLLSLTLLLFMIAFAIYVRKNNICWMIMTAVLSLVIPYSFGALLFHQSELFITTCARRYTLIPISFFGFTLIALQNHFIKSSYVKLCYLFITLYFISGFSSFLHPFHFPKSTWQSDAQIWEKNHNYRPRPVVIPLGADLSDGPIIPCTKFRDHSVFKIAPSYCEENWIASIEELLHEPLLKTK